MTHPPRLAPAALLGVLALGGCSDRVPASPPPHPTPDVLVLFRQSALDKVDLLLMLDNSRSMADKQLILAAAVPDLVGALANPKCLDSSGADASSQPQSPLENCPTGTRRRITPLTDIHIGIVTSSLGGHGSDACSTAETQSCNGSPNPSNNDAGHLITRGDPCGGASLPTYQGKGFLAWDPAAKLSPPGEKALGAITVDPVTGAVSTLSPGLIPALKDLVVGVGQVGCGYEAQLESWYRFLVDPEPYQTISVIGGKATPAGIDSVLLQQRRDFLRPSSLLAILMLTDENDCSVKEYGQFYYATQQRNPTDNKKSFHLPRARKECATDPNDPCCKSCGQAADGCPVDDTCTMSPTLTDLEDDINLRCWDQKRRFGVDFLNPIDRYTQAITSLTVPNRQGDLVQNPLYMDLDPSDADSTVRDTGLVFLAGIVGVPWQDIARDPGDLRKGFKSSEELSTKDQTGESTWDLILGDLANNVPAKDPHMVESIKPRAGLPGPTSAQDADPFHGHEYSIPKNDDLQYACIFDLPAPRDCAGGKLVSCDCQDPTNDNPLCDPATKTTQVRAKSYPGRRELAALKSVGDQGIVASVCPKQLTDAASADYGYRPAIGAIVDRLTPSDGQGSCLPVQLTPVNGQVSCVMLEARNTKGTCSCDAKDARQDVQAAHQQLITAALAFPVVATAGLDCFCEIVQAGDPAASTPEALAACLGDPSQIPVIKGGKDDGENAAGWCYVDPSRTPASNPALVQDCPANDQRQIRFVGAGAPKSEATVFISCSGG